MIFPERQQLKQDATRALSMAPEANRLILIFSGSSAAASLLVAFLSFLLDSGIAGTGGLSGMGLRSMLSSIQAMLSLVLTLLLPFWGMGYVKAVMKLGRRENARTGDLFAGFRRFGPVLRTLILEYALFLLAGIVCCNVGSTVLSMTPLGRPLAEQMAQMDPNLLMSPDEATLKVLLEAMIPLLIGCGVLFAAASVVLSYHFRMAQYLIMDDPQMGAIQAVVGSFRMMRGNCLQLLRMDLSFWWYYLLEIVATAVCLGDLWLPYLGVTFPFSDDAAYFLFYIVGLALQLAVHWKFRNHLEVSYALAYDRLKDQYTTVPTAQ